MKNHSQYDEADFLRKYFSANPPKYKNLVDIGAKGIDLSNTYDLLLDGWRGFMIEPLPEHYEELVNSLYDVDAYILNVAVSDFNGEAEFFVHNIPGHSSLVRQSDTSIKVQVVTPDRVFTYFNIPTDFDLLSIDTEGNDGKIIKCILETSYRPTVLIYEKNSGVDDKLVKKFYKPIYETEGNLVYERK